MINYITYVFPLCILFWFILKVDFFPLKMVYKINALDFYTQTNMRCGWNPKYINPEETFIHIYKLYKSKRENFVARNPVNIG